ncbi:prepilin peptidase [Solemya velum gill symbiont]|uniref:prepilin peptidase n=1 Tax=Solemya velum gill symbiont TaxID=2340 RepID=UPI0009988129|nr:A24 family peptidase [Solemya velum gill symbiont]OOZ15914.1 prepilin peptidase [Solemya velum gill symbiont]OOZ20320.1 prepilin peptidase [Solemya velum gill symbiont]OOZ23928.1 prepilin peptidase [Solemya velum gill symbiont]OOZ25811.1 prepilin peptidase [Solemya velum gill symbiont]OOZ30683.1 prepilin peptidase [Solemya velum gill symbiont]
MQDLQLVPLPLILVFACIIGLLVGSFLNVLILRLPARMKYSWRLECEEFLGKEVSTEDEPPGIILPASHCPTCKTRIKPWHNIPVISYLLLRGKCHTCNTSISLRYPFIELLTGLLTLYAIIHFGVTAQALAAIILVWALIALTFIDIDEQLLPDSITLPLVWLGLFINTQSLFASPVDAIYGAVFAYLLLWSIYHLFRLVTGKDGMGFGDFKLLSLFGAWFGWQLLPQILIISSLSGVLGAVILMLAGKARMGKALPFGPYLALGGLIALFWGNEINTWYLGISGLA